MVVKKGKKPCCKLESKSFWLVLGVVFLASVVVILSNTNQSSLTGNAAVQVVAFAKEGTVLDFEVRNVENLKSAQVTFTETVKNIKIDFTETDKPAWNFKGNVLSTFKISSAAESSIGDVALTLKIWEKDLFAANINSKDVQVYANGKELTTTRDKLEGEYWYYTTTTSEFGDFVIGREIKKVAAPVVKKPVPVPPVVEEPVEVVIPVIEEPKEEECKGFFACIGDFFKKFFGN